MNRMVMVSSSQYRHLLRLLTPRVQTGSQNPNVITSTLASNSSDTPFSKTAVPHPFTRFPSSSLDLMSSFFPSSLQERPPYQPPYLHAPFHIFCPTVCR